METTFNPKVSIIIPVYNGENYLRDSIDSALRQTYKNIEIIVVDDGSTDKTEQIAKSYGNKIRYYKKENGGTSSALNYGIEKMSGEYFSWLSHDDLYLEEKIEVQINRLKQLKNKEVIISCNVKVVDANLNMLSIMKMNEKLLESSSLLFLALDTDTGLNGCSLLIPKTCFDKVGKFDDKCLCTQDYDMWFRLTKFYSFINCPDVLVLSRRHDKQDSVTKTNICTDEADNLHSNMLNTFNDITNLEKYISEEYIISKYNIYKISGYNKTAASILKIIIDYYLLKNKIEKLYLFAIKYLGLSIEVSLEHFSNMVMKKNERLNIVFFNNVWISGGVENMLSNIFFEISKNYNITLIATKIDEKHAPAMPSAVDRIMIDKTEDIFSIAGISYCLHTNIFVGNPNINNAFLYIYEILKIFNIKSIGLMHYNYFLPYKVDFLKPVITKRMEMYKNIDVVVCLTDYFNQIYSVFNKNGITIPNILNIDIKDVEREKKHNHFKLLSIARFDDDIKRIDRLLKVFSLIYKKNNNVTLDVVGLNGEENFYNRTGMTIKQFLQKNNIPEDRIIFHGEKSNVQEFYEKCDIYISTSESEGFGMTLLEAISFRMPVVMMKINGTDILVENDQNGYVVDQDDLNEMSNKILVIMNDNTKYEKMSNISYEMSKRFEKKITIKKWIDLFEAMKQDTFNIKTYRKENKTIEKYYIEAIAEYEETIKEIMLKDPRSINEGMLNNTIKLLTDDNIVLNKQLTETSAELDKLKGIQIDLNNNIRDLQLELNNKLVIYNKMNRFYRYYLEYGKRAFLKRILKKIFKRKNKKEEIPNAENKSIRSK